MSGREELWIVGCVAVVAVVAMFSMAGETPSFDSPTVGYATRFSSAAGSGGPSNLQIGWTSFKPGSETKIVYVSSSDVGSCEFYDHDDPVIGPDPFHPVGPVETCGTLTDGYNKLRSGKGDWMLLKRGDVFADETLKAVSGKAAREPTLISSYGDVDERPLVRSGSEIGFKVTGAEQNYIALAGIHFQAPPEGNGKSGINIVINHGSYFFMEGIKVENYQDGLNVQGLDADSGGLTRVVLRRSVVTNNFNPLGTPTHGEKAQGAYFNGVNGLVIEENVFHHNGWKEGAHAANIYSHNFYITDKCSNVRVEDNIVSKGSSHGLQLRPGGVASGNLFVANSIGMFTARASSSVHNNVFLQGRDNFPEEVAGLRGWGMETLEVEGATVSNNIFANTESTNVARYAMQAGHEADITEVDKYIAMFSNNIVYDWGKGFVVPHSDDSVYSSITVEDNIFVDTTDDLDIVKHKPSAVDQDVFTYSGNSYYTEGELTFEIGGLVYGFDEWTELSGDEGSSFSETVFSDPDRTVDSYHASIGGAGTFDAFMAEAVLQSPFYWREEYTAPAVNSYVRAGFLLVQS